MAPSVSNRKWWLGQLSPHSQPLSADHLSPSILPLFSTLPLAWAAAATAAPLAHAHTHTHSSLPGTAELNCPPTGSIIGSSLGVVWGVCSSISPRFPVSSCVCVLANVCFPVCVCLRVCVCVCRWHAPREQLNHRGEAGLLDCPRTDGWWTWSGN